MISIPIHGYSVNIYWHRYQLQTNEVKIKLRAIGNAGLSNKS
jgi:hypothetical protein